jgi:hypothetical protein
VIFRYDPTLLVEADCPTSAGNVEWLRIPKHANTGPIVFLNRCLAIPRDVLRRTRYRTGRSKKCDDPPFGIAPNDNWIPAVISSCEPCGMSEPR